MFSKNKLKKHSYFLDALRVLSCIAIIALHVNHNSILDSSTLTGDQNLLIALIQSFIKWAVPMFFMISGYIFLGVKDECTYDSMKKYYIRMILIMLFIFTGFNIVELFINNRGLYLGIFKEALYLTLQGKSWDHLWFIPTIFVMYLIFPLIRPFFDNNDKNLDTFIILYYIFTIIIPELNRVLRVELFTSFIFSYEAFYCFLGGYLYRKKVDDTTKNNVFMIILLLIVLSLKTYVYIETRGIVNLTSNSQRLLTSIEVFLIFNIFANIFNNENELMRVLSNYTIYIYIFHVVYVHILTKVIKFFPYEYKYFYILAPLTIFGVFLISFITSVIVKPIMNFIQNTICKMLQIEE